ncbi:hypothetical protein ACFWIQ_37530 [Kitasatospora sp. NPDC127059]|uniref:hypothetical protein n=1 Tax=unclassified Kitasatospora TaxID=2633591 RepID=UPI00364AD04E
MNTESMHEDEDVRAAEAAVSWELGDLAESVETGPVPYERLVAGGRRRLRRRRLLTAVAVATMVVVVGGAGAAFEGHGRGAGGAVVAAAASPSTAAPAASPGSSASVPGAPSTGATATATPSTSPSDGPSGAPRDPFTPMRARIAGGTTVSGHTWEAWVAEWPSPATEQDALKQDKLMQVERLAAGSDLKSLIPRDSKGNWVPHCDIANLYYTVDGKRQPDDVLYSLAEPRGPFTGGIGGLSASLGLKDRARTGLPPVVIGAERPEVAKIVITWDTGDTTEVAPIPVGDSVLHWYAVMAKPGAGVKTYTAYGADGSVERTTDQWVRTN